MLLAISGRTLLLWDDARVHLPYLNFLMAPPSDHPCLELSVKDTPFFVKKLEPSAIIPEFFLKEFAAGYSGRFLSITRTPDEISIVGEAHDSYGMLEEEVKWRCIKIAGPMDFGP